MIPSASASPVRVLLLLGQSSFDPTSGAAQSMRQIAQLLAANGAQVRSLSTTGTEGLVETSIDEQLANAGGKKIHREKTLGTNVWCATARGIDYELVEIAHTRRHSWEHLVGHVYSHRLDAIRRDFKPQLVLTFGGDVQDIRRRKQLRADGARVVFALHNLDYLSFKQEHVDAFLAPSRFLAARYESAWSRKVTVLPPPVDEQTVRAENAEPVCVSFINPEPAKGAAVVAKLAQRLGRERPDVPLLISGGRAACKEIEAVAQKLGFSLREFPNLLQAPPTTRVAEMWAPCRVLLAPSIVEEAAGRVALEAMLNGAVPIVSNRGGLPEMLATAGHVIPFPETLTVRAPFAVPDTLIDEIWSKLIPLMDDPAHFAAMSAAARATGERHSFAVLAPAYTRWLESLLT